MSVALSEINVEEKKILLEIIGGSGQTPPRIPPQLILEVSTKPLMMVVWTGVVLIIAGSLMAFRRRFKGTEGTTLPPVNV